MKNIAKYLLEGFQTSKSLCNKNEVIFTKQFGQL